MSAPALVDDLVEAMGGAGISKSGVSRICAGPDETVGAFRTLPLGHVEFSYTYLDATYLHVRNKPGEGGQIVSMAVGVATGVSARGGSGRSSALTSATARTRSSGVSSSTPSSSVKLGEVQLVISDQQAVDLYESTSGATVRGIAEDVGIVRVTLRGWLEAYCTGKKTAATGR